MAIRTTVDIPEPLHRELRRRAAQTGVSKRSLIVQALVQCYGRPKQTKRRVTGPLITGKGTRGPRYPVDENPHELVFS
jgi:metal-responsive CopG/Arc/MetJ family transcriptional regulator